MIVTPTVISDVIILEPKVFGDSRGFFFESFNQQVFNDAIGQNVLFVQDNHSRSERGVLRGLHYQVKQPQGKLVRVVRGAVFDVAVDIRKSSPTFRQWVGVELSEDNHHQLWVPAGFAHGFYVMSRTAELVYKCTDFYASKYERTLLWNDQKLNISWPLIDGVTTVLSDKDAEGKAFEDVEYYP